MINIFAVSYTHLNRGRPYKFAISGNRSALTLAGLVPSAGLSARPAHAAGGTLAPVSYTHLDVYKRQEYGAFLKYVPKSMLSEEQLNAAREAQQKQDARVQKLREEIRRSLSVRCV